MDDYIRNQKPCNINAEPRLDQRVAACGASPETERRRVRIRTLQATARRWLDENSEARHLALWQRVNFFPKRLPPLPTIAWLKGQSKPSQRAILMQRATELTLEIEGLRKGRLQPRWGMSKPDMIRNARRRLDHLHEAAIVLGLWEEFGCSLSEE